MKRELPSLLYRHNFEMNLAPISSTYKPIFYFVLRTQKQRDSTFLNFNLSENFESNYNTVRENFFRPECFIRRASWLQFTFKELTFLTLLSANTCFYTYYIHIMFLKLQDMSVYLLKLNYSF